MINEPIRKFHLFSHQITAVPDFEHEPPQPQNVPHLFYFRRLSKSFSENVNMREFVEFQTRGVCFGFVVERRVDDFQFGEVLLSHFLAEGGFDVDDDCEEEQVGERGGVVGDLRDLGEGDLVFDGGEGGGPG